MRKRLVDIPTGGLFELHFQFMAVVASVVGLAIIKLYVLIAVCLLVISAFILSARSGLEIDMQRKRYREYLSFFFVKRGSYLSFDSVDKIFINSSAVTRTIYAPRSNKSASFTNKKYNAFVKFSDGAKFLLASRGSKDRLLRCVRNIAVHLETDIEDQTREMKA